MTGDQNSAVFAFTDAQRRIHVVVPAWAARSPVSPASLYAFEFGEKVPDGDAG